MDNSIKFFLPILTVSLAAYGLTTIRQHITIPRALASDINIEDSGLVTIASPYEVKETGDCLENIISEKGLTLFNRIDHSANAADAELELSPAEVLILGNPKVGTPLMQCSITTAIDLPQKILVYRDEDSQTKIAYNHPKYLKQRHNIKGCDEVLDKVSGALKGITEAAVVK